MKNFKLFEREGFDDIYGYNEEDDKYDEIDFENEIEELSGDDVIDNLISTVRSMLRNSNFSKFSIYKDDEDGAITIQFILKHVEKMPSIMKIMNFLKKLEDDIFQGYEAEFDLWETKTFDPLITVKFFSNTDDEMYDDKDLPF